jgi:hypothetical protein
LIGGGAPQHCQAMPPALHMLHTITRAGSGASLHNDDSAGSSCSGTLAPAGHCRGTLGMQRRLHG